VQNVVRAARQTPCVEVDLGCHGLMNKSAGLGLLWRHRGQVSEITSTASSLAACGGARQSIESLWPKGLPTDTTAPPVGRRRRG
jgi:hypothetical protein